MANEYSSTSPWFKTPIEKDKLSIFRIRPVSAQPDDFLYTIEPQYTFRPDLLSYDLYQTTRLWWVFTQRNMDILQDPIWDFKAGTTIYLPKKSALFQILGL
jgi:hypothetical protein